ncbi:MAG: hypothetical protein IJ424_02935 [Oscillospiraceae bacterium]|nr:hypothetical protein [Oscillospiraceae bacterium]
MLNTVTLGDVMEFFLKCGFIFAGLYVLIVLTPKIAAFIDKKRAQHKSPYESAPDPARVDDDAFNDENNDENPRNEDTDSNNNN